MAYSKRVMHHSSVISGTGRTFHSPIHHATNPGITEHWATWLSHTVQGSA